MHFDFATPKGLVTTPSDEKKDINKIERGEQEKGDKRVNLNKKEMARKK